MNIQDKTDLIKYCDRLSVGGKELAITWDGGGDDGCFDIHLNDKQVEDDGEYFHQLIELAADTLGYGSFAGDFCTRGRLVYDPEAKCFGGYDNYSETDSATKDCNIIVSVPAGLWFDRIEIQLEADPGISSAGADFIILNGPKTALHEQWEQTLSEWLLPQLEKELKEIEGFDGCWQLLQLNHGDFERQGDTLQYTIGQIAYSYRHYDEKDIFISLTENC